MISKQANTKKTRITIIVHLISYLLMIGIWGILSANITFANPTWDYTKAAGPEKWGTLSIDYKTCSTGQSQSPISIQNPIINSYEIKPEFHYTTATAKIVEITPTPLIQTDKKSYLTYKRQTYKLSTIQYFMPSNHQINHKNTDIELQFLHEDMDGKWVGLVILGQLSQQNDPLMAQLSDLFKSHETQPTKSIQLSLSSIIKPYHQFYSYNGSLITPPCSEPVQWFVINQPFPTTKSSLDTLKTKRPSPTVRPLQPLNKRKVYLIQ